MKLELTPGDTLEVVIKGAGTLRVSDDGISFRRVNAKLWEGPLPLNRAEKLCAVWSGDPEGEEKHPDPPPPCPQDQDQEPEFFESPARFV